MLKLIVTPPCPLPDTLRDEDGFYSVFIPASVSASLNFETASLSELGSIVSSFSNTFELVADRRTQDLFSRLHFRKTAHGLSAKVAGGLLMNGHYFPGMIFVRSTRQNVLSGNLTYSIQFAGTHQTWKDAARLMSICQIDCGTLYNSPANVEASWANSAYTPGGQPYYLPLVSKGAWLNPNFRIVEDFDFIVVYLAHLLLQGFCNLGYTIESEFIHTTEFRKKAAYLLSDAYFNREGLVKFGSFRAFVPAPFDFTGTGGLVVYDPVGGDQIGFFGEKIQQILYTDDFTLPDGFDYNNLYAWATSEFTGYTGACAFSASATLDFNFNPVANDPGYFAAYCILAQDQPLTFRLVIKAAMAGGTVSEIGSSEIVSIPPCTPAGTVTLAATSFAANLYSTDKVYVEVHVTNIWSSWTFEVQSGTFSNKPGNNIIQRNQTLVISELFDCEVNFYQLLEDLVKLYNLQFYTNEVEKKVYIEPEYAWQDWTGLPHSGILRGIADAYDITPLVNAKDDFVKEFADPGAKRYLQLLFAEGNDWHCTRYEEENNRELHSSDKVEVGISGTETEEVRLSLFAPTQTIYDEPDGFSDPTAMQVPAYWSAAPDAGSLFPAERSYSIGRRILHIHGMVVQPNKYGNLPVWYFEDTTPRNAYPKAWQVNKDNPSNSSIVFGSPITGKTQTTTFFKNLQAIRQMVPMSATLTIRPNNIACLDTRNPVLINSAAYPAEVAGYYYIRKLNALNIAGDVYSGEVELLPLSFAAECSRICDLSASTSYTNPAENGGSDGSITITGSTGYSGLVAVAIVNSENTVVFNQTGIDPALDFPLTIPDLLAGVYIVTITDEAGCTVQAQVILYNPCVVVIDAAGTNPTAEGASDGSITINTLTGVLYPVAVIVKLGAANVFSQSGVTAPDLPLTAAGLSAGNYTIIVIDSGGCATQLPIILTDVGDCLPPADFAVTAITDVTVTLNWTVTAGNTYNIRYKLTADAVWTTLTAVTPALLIPGLDPCLDYEFQIETICGGESIGFSQSIIATTDCPCSITFTVTALVGGGIAITGIEGLSEGASPIIVVTDCEGNPVPAWWDSVPDCYKVCVIDSCTCCRGCQTSCFITLDMPAVSECAEDGTVNVFIDVLNTNYTGNLQFYYSLNGLTWYNGGLSLPGTGWQVNGIPASGGQMWLRIENPQDEFCNAETVINLPDCCGNPGISIVTDACDTYPLWITSDSFDIPYTAALTQFTYKGTTYTPPSPLSFTDLTAVEAWLNSLGLEVYFLVVLPSTSTANIYVIGKCCEEYEAGDFQYIAIDGATPYNVTLEFLANMTCDLIQSGTPLFTCCTCIQAVPTGTVYGVDTDIMEYSLDGGLTWFPYGGECIDPDENALTFRRTVTFTNGCPTAEITDTYVPPGCQNDLGLTVNCEPMVEAWLIPIDEANTLVSITIDGTTYTPPSPIPLTDYTALAAYFNGLGTDYYFLFSDGGPGTDATVVTILGAPCYNYQNGDLFATYNDGAANHDIYLGLYYEQPCSFWAGLLPGYTCPECCTCATAQATGTASGINNDIIEFSIDGGVTWFEYFPPQCINPTIYDSNEVIFRRIVNFDNGCPPVVLTESVVGVLPCVIIITDADMVACPDDSYELWVMGGSNQMSAQITSITVNGTTYTPPAPIAVSNIAALLAFFNSNPDGVQFNFTYVTGMINFWAVQMLGACGLTYSNVSVQFNDNANQPQVANLSLSGSCDCAYIAANLPEFACSNPCNGGNVDVQVTFTASGVSGNVVVEVGSLGSQVVPANAGSVTINVPANGETVQVSVYSQDNPACIYSVEITLPDC